MTITNKKLFDTLLFTSFLAILLIAGTVIFGLNVLYIALVSYIVSILIELLFSRIRKKEMGYSWMITPLLFTLFLPPSIPLWIAGVGAGFGTFYGKMLFGGEGKYIFNPAMVGILFITISFPVFLNTKWLDPITQIESTVNPLINLTKGGTFNYTTFSLFFGNTPGFIGSTFRFGILVLGLVLIVLKKINWRTPVFYIIFFFLFTLLFNVLSPDTARDPYLSVITGSLLLAAFFVAPDPATTPINNKGVILYGIGLGFFTALIRNYAVAPEGVVFAIIIMNAISPLIDSYFKNKKEVIPNE